MIEWVALLIALVSVTVTAWNSWVTRQNTAALIESTRRVQSTVPDEKA